MKIDINHSGYIARFSPLVCIDLYQVLSAEQGHAVDYLTKTNA